MRHLSSCVSSRMTFPNRQHRNVHILEGMIMALAICPGPLNNHTWSPLCVYGAIYDSDLRKHFPPSAQRWRPFGDLLTMIMLVMISTDISLGEMSRSKTKCQSPTTTTAYKRKPNHSIRLYSSVVHRYSTCVVIKKMSCFDLKPPYRLFIPHAPSPSPASPSALGLLKRSKWPSMCSDEINSLWPNQMLCTVVHRCAFGNLTTSSGFPDLTQSFFSF